MRDPSTSTKDAPHSHNAIGSTTLPPPPPALADTAEEAPPGGASLSDDSDDEVADFRALLPQLLKEKNGRTGGNPSSSSHSTGAIPKRGEKDFEPTGFKGQEKKLQESRQAMEMVISQERRTSSKSLSKAIWDPTLNRAVVQVSQGTTISSLGVTSRYPVIASSSSSSSAGVPPGSNDTIGPQNQVGVLKAGVFYPRMTSQVELFPEEALYLIERGTLECTVPMRLADAEETVQVPLSLQHAFSLMIGKDGCTRERYQTYTYLKRLGYYLQRAQVTDELRAKAKKKESDEREKEADYGIRVPDSSAKGIVADPKRPLRLVTIWDLLTYVPRRLAQIVASGWQAMSAAIRSLADRVLGRKSNVSSTGLQGRGLLGIGGRTWDSWDSVYSTLRIIPSGHNAQSTRAPHHPPPPPSSTVCSSNPFLPFFYAWRPATQFKKTNPPLPEYRIAVVSARDTSLPKMDQFTGMFDAVPMPVPMAVGPASAHVDDQNQDNSDAEEQRRAAEQKKRNDESYGRGYAAKKKMADVRAAREKKKQHGAGISQGGEGEGTAEDKPSDPASSPSSSSSSYSLLTKLLSRLQNLYTLLCTHFLHFPPGCHSTLLPPQAPHRRNYTQTPRKSNPFPPLKAGRRDVIVAIVDHGTSSLVRFGEAEFERWRLFG